MSESNLNTDQAKIQQSKRRFPAKMLVFTAIVAVVLAVMHSQMFLLNDRFNINPGTINLLTMLLVFIMIVAWVCWALFLGRQRLLGVAILGTVIVLLTLFMPIFGGDANIIGWKPRFWRSQPEFATVATETVNRVDVSTTTHKDFPQFLGPERNAEYEAVKLLGDWSSTPPQQIWKQPIGEGWSAFAAVNGYAVTQEQRGPDECVTCYEIESGNLQWIYKSKRRHEDITNMGKVGPRATPTIADGLVYVTSGTGVLDCLDGATGELIWSADVPRLVDIQQARYTTSAGIEYTMEDSRLMWGRAGSPLVYEDKVIVAAGGPQEGNTNKTATLIAFDKKTGSEIWRGGNRMVAYGSPSFATLLGQPQILLVAEDHAVGHDPETGAELWSHERPGKSDQDANCSQVTVVSDSRLILSKGYHRGGELVELSQTGDGIDIKTIDKDPRILKTKFTNPVLYNGHAYSLSDGYLECVEIDTFRRKWKERGPDGRFGNGQVLLVGDKLLVHSEFGRLYLVAAQPDRFELLGSIATIDGTCWNTLCLYGNKLLVRSEVEAACFELPIVNDTQVATNE